VIASGLIVNIADGYTSKRSFDSNLLYPSRRLLEVMHRR
jgi:hypothetical protein